MALTVPSVVRTLVRRAAVALTLARALVLMLMLLHSGIGAADAGRLPGAWHEHGRRDDERLGLGSAA